MTAWDNCNKLLSHQTEILPQIAQDNLTVNFLVRNGGSDDVSIQAVRAENFDCAITSPSGAVSPLTLPLKMPRQAINISCNRAKPVSVTVAGENFSKIERATVSVLTGDTSMLLYFPPEDQPELPEAAAKAIREQLSKAMQAAPPGTVVAYAGSELPAGWLWCDGGIKARSEYSALFASIKETYGKGNGATTFQLPDYRGMFLRGVDREGSNQDKDRLKTGEGLGSPQVFATHATFAVNQGKGAEVSTE